MIAIDFDGFVMLTSYMLLRLAVPVVAMILLSKGLRRIAPQAT